MEKDDSVKRSVIWFLWKQGKYGAQIFRAMGEVFKEDTPLKMTISRWIERFSNGAELIEDAERSGRPKDVRNSFNIERVQTKIDQDHRQSVQQLAEALSINHNTVHQILTEDLGMTRVVARWVPKLLTQEQKKARVDISLSLLQLLQDQPDFLSRIVTTDESWFHYYEPETKAQSSQWKAKGEPTPLKAATVAWTRKQMATVFWDRGGILQIDWLPQGEMINSDYFIGCLRHLRETLKKKRRGTIIKVFCFKWTMRTHTPVTEQWMLLKRCASLCSPTLLTVQT